MSHCYRRVISSSLRDNGMCAFRMCLLLVSFLFMLLSTSSAMAVTIALQPLPYTFEQPLYVTSLPHDANTLFIVEKVGVIRIVHNGTLLPDPFLDLRDRVSQGYEQGLLGLALHPQFSSNGLFFVNYTDQNGNTQIVRYKVKAGEWQADISSRRVILSIEQPAANHNGGMLAFGLDGYLYIATGDGGRAGDPWSNAQNLNTLLGKLLRIDVDTSSETYTIPQDNPFYDVPNARQEIWAYGLRNPWRFSFDRDTGDVFIADVGQDAWEEVNFQPASSTGGDNYGWNVMEGLHCYPPGRQCNSEAFVLPIIEYAHSRENGCSITGGYVYRGSNIPHLAGKYVFADYCSGRMWQAEYVDDNKEWQVTVLYDSSLQLSSFGEDANGELYVTDLSTGLVYKMEVRN